MEPEACQPYFCALSTLLFVFEVGEESEVEERKHERS